MIIKRFDQVRPTPILLVDLVLEHINKFFVSMFDALKAIRAHKLQSLTKETQVPIVNRLGC
jgi:hypothetical protein